MCASGACPRSPSPTLLAGALPSALAESKTLEILDVSDNDLTALPAEWTTAPTSISAPSRDLGLLYTFGNAKLQARRRPRRPAGRRPRREHCPGVLSGVLSGACCQACKPDSMRRPAPPLAALQATFPVGLSYYPKLLNLNIANSNLT